MNQSLSSQKTKRMQQWAAFFLLLVLVFVRYCYFEFAYYYQLDDYIQYHNYIANPENTSAIDIIVKLGLLGARPLAGIFDIFVWSRCFPVMLLGVFVLSALFAASGCIFKSTLEKHVEVTPLFLVFYALLPLGLEGVYWVSASSRIVCGLFFGALSAMWFDRWCQKGKVRYGVLFAVFNLLGYGFYEQTMVLSCALTILLALFHWERSGKRKLLALVSVLNVGIYFLLTSYFMKTSILYSARAQYALPTSLYYFTDFLPEVFRQIGSVFFIGNGKIFLKGLWRSAGIFLASPNFIYLVILVLACALLYWLAKREMKQSEQTKGKKLIALFAALYLAAAPLAPFFVIAPVWLSLRGAVASFLGVALFADTIIGWIFSKCKKKEKYLALIAAGLAFLFCFSSISELSDYRQTTSDDRRISVLTKHAINAQGMDEWSQKIGILNLEKSYLETQNFPCHEHIHGVTESPWAFTGAMVYESKLHDINISPIPANPMYMAWNKDSMRLSNFDSLYLYLDGQIRPLRIEYQQQTQSARLFDKETGKYYGYTYEEDNCGYLVLE